MRLVQFELRNGERRVGVVQGSKLREVRTAGSVRELALAAPLNPQPANTAISFFLNWLHQPLKRLHPDNSNSFYLPVPGT